MVVPTFNRKEGVRKTVESVLADSVTDEVVVVVDGSTDGTYEMLQEMASGDSRVRPLYTNNDGEGHARQAGAEMATGDVLLFLDDDVVADKGLVAGHLKHHAARTALVVTGYMSTALAHPRGPGEFATALYAREYEATCDEWVKDPASIFDLFWAGNFSIRRSDALKVAMVGLVPMPYNEDMVFGYRCRANGLMGKFDPSLRVHHVHQRSLESFVTDARRQGEAALIIHRSHSNGSFPFSDEQAFPLLVKWVIRVGASKRGGSGVQRLMRLGIGASGRLHLFYVETYLAMILRSSVQRQTVLELEASDNSRAELDNAVFDQRR